MSNKRSDSIISKISYTIIVIFVGLLLLLFICFFAKFTNGFTSSFATFYVEYDGKTIASDKPGYVFELGKKYDFKVGYTLGFLNNEEKTFSVEVIPNITDKTDFNYMLSSETHNFSSIKSLTSYFDIEGNENGFTFSASKTLEQMVAQYHNNDVIGVPAVNESSVDYLKLVISSEDNSQQINLTFNLAVPAESVIIDGGAIIVG